MIVVSELSFGECGKKQTSESPHFPFTSILNANFGYLIMEACCVFVFINKPYLQCMARDYKYVLGLWYLHLYAYTVFGL